MRLIDAENLMTVTDIRENGTEITYVPYSEIESAPTAYDPDEVVEQLEDRKSLMLETFKISESDIDRGRIYGMDKAIEIVKGGGVND